MSAVRIDLHVHSSASDGTDPPAEVVRRAAAASLDAVALTDHDTVAGIAEARQALPPGLTLVPGMELSCMLDNSSMHMLAYLFDPADPALSAETELMRDDRIHRAKGMVGKLRELGAPVTWEQVSRIADGAVVGRPHIARAMAESGVVETPADAFTSDWIADGGRAHVGRYAPDPERAIALVRAAGGVPVLAHPRSPGYEIGDEVIARLAAAGLAGLEVFHPDHDDSERSRLTALATRLGLLMTGGSDDHGSFSGGGPGAETTPPGEYERLVSMATAIRPVTTEPR
jgi:predicted metal-dependent phosphoesterase TrpH